MLRSLFTRSQPATAAAPSPTPGEVARPTVIDLTKKAAISLDKNGLSGQRAAVYLVLDRSGSMRSFYQDGTVQYLAEQVLGLARNLDDDGQVPVVFFSTTIDGTTVVSLDNHAGKIQAVHSTLGPMGRTHYEAALEHVIKLHRSSEAYANGIPGLVVFQSDGEPSNRPATERILRAASRDEDLFWAFVGYGRDVDFLSRIDSLSGRPVDNTSHFHAQDPRNVSDSALYDGITSQFKSWITATRAAGSTR